MKIIIRRPKLSPRMRLWVRWGQSLLVICGLVALSYVGLSLLDAKLYQVSAKRSLEDRIEVAKGHEGIQPTRVVEEGDVLARMDIPRLGVSVAVLQGTKWRLLRLGAGHIESTPLPGEAGNSGIAGHRDTYFRKLKDIRQDDEIQLQTATGLSHYRVDWVKVVDPDDLNVLAASTESSLTLVTCYPFYFLGPAPKRFVVHARKN